MFTVTEHSHKLGNVNPRAELHGDEHVLAVDLSVELKGPNTLLDMLDPDLRTALFRKMNGTEAQGDLMADDPEYLPSLKFPKLGPLKYDYEGAGYTTRVHLGIDAKSNIVLADTSIDKFVIECHDGGGVTVKYRIIAHPKTEDVGRLAELTQQDVTLTLEPPQQ